MSSDKGPLKNLFQVLSDKYPHYKSQIHMAEGYAARGATALDAAAPYLARGGDYVQVAREKAAQFRLDELAPMLIGLALCFFGGHYTMLIAAVETVRLLCWEDLSKSFASLYKNYQVAVEQNRKDNAVDADGNGIADVLEMKKAEVLSRKIALFMKSVDVEEVQTATRTLSAAALSVIASLRVKLARSLTLGASIAKMGKDYVPLEKILHDALPPDQKKWAGMVAESLLNMMAMTVAMVLSGPIITVHCCIRGAHLFVQKAVELAKERGLLEEQMSMESPKAKALMVVVATTGCLWQAAHRGGMPFPMNLLLLPLTIMEWILKTVVGGGLMAAPAPQK